MQDIVTSHRVLIQLFYSSGVCRVDLGSLRLRNSLGCNAADLPRLVRNALEAARERWHVTPRGSEKEQRFIRFVSALRYDFGSPNWEDFLRYARSEDKSHDPVSF